MAHSLEALFMFVEAATLGSFSAAARKLHKQQSTVSEAIANLEIDFGLLLFDRSTRRPTLTEQGKAMLIHAQQVLDAHDRLSRSAHRLAGGLEPTLTLVLSDMYQSMRFDSILIEFERRYPELELECMIAEHTDVVALVQEGRAQLGLVGAQQDYPPDVGFESMSERSEIGLYVGNQHPLAAVPHVTTEMLHDARELRLNTYLNDIVERRRGLCWSSSSYLLLLEMTELGFGWAELPRWLAKRFAADGLLELQVRGWPKTVQVDAVWSRRHGLGQAGGWLLDTLLAP
ncbi:LysR family transcriptional regulator [Glaciimonas immobilis]|uniref:DNA-binding transcriptional LysR family regulator n=1 Tax=Glaciimonas immobilis TaxID=728004 RepID=A0A840RQJ6_9BURK|nr:LysR family transcriptional regulator [Glaciimonas immobilis]KAF3999287.1 LysR family transcriptional regulator [Glaciimonas immobilis]MBB5198759.1 DNA-binding transcriptional LysR family regulator [Glaciimonas immobilis]